MKDEIVWYYAEPLKMKLRKMNLLMEVMKGQPPEKDAGIEVSNDADKSLRRLKEKNTTEFYSGGGSL